CCLKAGRRRDLLSTRMDRYRVNEVVGSGGFGQAVLCTRKTDNKACIIKQINIPMLSPEARREARKEATLLENLSHPSIVGFWESFFHGPSEGLLCIVMDYADGGDLGDYLKKRNGRLLDEELIFDWFVQMTSALRYIHEKNILHRDLKPMNVFLTGSGTIKLGDFGIAKVLECTADMANSICGTPFYMAPEVLDYHPYGHKADMWSLGCILYEMARLRRPFTSVAKIFQTDPEPIPASRYSAELRSLVDELLRKDPHARPSTD
ncbi:unnamed protein product, partial [Ectocarpus fasciculatus]